MLKEDTLGRAATFEQMRKCQAHETGWVPSMDGTNETEVGLWDKLQLGEDESEKEWSVE